MHVYVFADCAATVTFAFKTLNVSVAVYLLRFYCLYKQSDITPSVKSAAMLKHGALPSRVVSLKASGRRGVVKVQRAWED